MVVGRRADDRGHNRRELSQRVLQLFLNHALRDGFFHADMHQGNLKVAPNPPPIKTNFETSNFPSTLGTPHHLTSQSQIYNSKKLDRDKSNNYRDKSNNQRDKSSNTLSQVRYSIKETKEKDTREKQRPKSREITKTIIIMLMLLFSHEIYHWLTSQSQTNHLISKQASRLSGIL